MIAQVGGIGRDSRVAAGRPGASYLRQPPSQRSIALSLVRDQSRAVWFAVSTLAMASIASSTLLYKINLPALFGHDRYEISLSGTSQKLQDDVLHREQGQVDADSSDEGSGPLLAKPLKTIRYLKPGTDEDAPIPTSKVSLGSTDAGAGATPDDSGVLDDPATRQAAASLGEVGQYLWEVYERTPTKRDGSGDFTWKDPTAAKRLGMSMPEYVIGGMDRDFREALYDAGRAMDAAGIKWAILSAFRDDYRQGLASGFKASVHNSLHGGSARTGGYGHGRAIDITSTDDDAETVWKWIDAHGAKFGLSRPMPRIDPGHIQSRGDWHMLAATMRQARIRSAQATAPAETTQATGNKLVANASR